MFWFVMGTTLYLFWSLQPGSYLHQKEKLIKYNDFVNKELILFLMADLQRSIPWITSGTYVYTPHIFLQDSCSPRMMTSFLTT
ncbi:hypothetical protein RHMOL_Rhmol04G0208300 [Rhododendron molle]|uniref:Uncharacterized protein n=1 Tax=Rhododendron molle TaxID=49168 RepID=A0ACC0P318_RHOML|nr:hypothetical protein RHMOL_Rhmol04G0208300 [Rhododendron molle]